MAKKKDGPQAVQPPTRDEVLALPFWPQVAFCARVARRVLPLVAHCWETEIPDDARYLGKRGHLKGTRDCVRLTELAAANAKVLDEQALYDARGVAAESRSQAEYAAQLAKRKPGAPQYAAGHAASVAEVAATAAFRRLKPDWNCELGLVVYIAGEAGKAFGAKKAVDAAIRADYETIKRLVAERQWGDDTPVSPRTFGPMWPQGAPQGWPQGR